MRDFSKDARTLSELLKEWLFQEWNEPYHQAFGELKNKLSPPSVLNFVEFDKPLEVHKGASDFVMVDSQCKLDDHCIWEHKARWLSKETTNSNSSP
jgi:hypothetical protein